MLTSKNLKTHYQYNESFFFSWNSKMKRAWLNMFRFITFFMSVGYGDGFLKCQKGQNGELVMELISSSKDKTENDEI